MGDQRERGGAQHPDEWRADLNPGSVEGAHPAKDARTAYDIKDLHQRLHGFNDSELKDVPVLPHDSHLEQGATYIDLYHLVGGEFTARGDERATEHHAYVPKKEVDYPLWNRLIGVDNPERLDTGNR